MCMMFQNKVNVSVYNTVTSLCDIFLFIRQHENLSEVFVIYLFFLPSGKKPKKYLLLLNKKKIISVVGIDLRHFPVNLLTIFFLFL